MRLLLAIILVSVSCTSHAQAGSIALKNAMRQLDKALLEKDSVALTQLLNSELSFGHSNGWIQGKKDVWSDFASGKLEYKKIDTKSVEIVSINKKWAAVRTSADVTGKAGGREYDMTLLVLQFWVKKKKGWQLLARQSAKLN